MDDQSPQKTAWSGLRDPFSNFGSLVLPQEWVQLGNSDLVNRLTKQVLDYT